MLAGVAEGRGHLFDSPEEYQPEERVVSGTEVDTPVTSRGQTPETCLGYERGDHYTSPEPEAHDVARSYSLPKFLPSDHWAFKGKWKVEGQRIVAQEADASLQLNFSSGKVFLVLGTEGNQPVKAIITLNGDPLRDAASKDAPGGSLTVKQHTLFELIAQKSPTNGMLEITATAPGLEAYACTFGS
jgi:hypothetical protein